MTVEERLEALEKELQQIKDVQAIKELKSKYFQALDTKNWDELETTMAPDIETAYSNGKLVFHGPKEITDYFKKSMPRQRLHFIRDITHRYGLRVTQLLTENGIWKTD